MTKPFVDEVLEKFDKFMVESGWGILIASGPTTRIYCVLNKLFFWIIYTPDNTWLIDYNDIKNVTRTAEFKTTGESDKDFLAILDKMVEILD